MKRAHLWGSRQWESHQKCCQWAMRWGNSLEERVLSIFKISQTWQSAPTPFCSNISRVANTSISVLVLFVLLLLLGGCGNDRAAKAHQDASADLPLDVARLQKLGWKDEPYIVGVEQTYTKVTPESCLKFFEILKATDEGEPIQAYHHETSNSYLFVKPIPSIGTEGISDAWNQAALRCRVMHLQYGPANITYHVGVQKQGQRTALSLKATDETGAVIADMVVTGCSDKFGNGWASRLLNSSSLTEADRRTQELIFHDLCN